MLRGCRNLLVLLTLVLTAHIANAAERRKIIINQDCSGPGGSNMTVVDRLGVASDERNRPIWDATLQNQRKVNVCWTIDHQRWKQLLFESLQRD